MTVSNEPGSANSALTWTRRLALDVLRSVREGELADRALAVLAADLPGRERAWLQELVYGTLRLRGRLDYFLTQLVRGGIETLEPDVLDVLRLGAYQLLEMGSVPDYAAVSQSVDLARAAGVGRAAGLVNGVLQGLRRRRDEFVFPNPAENPVDYLVAWGSHPRWLVERWFERWGFDATQSLIEANNRRPEIYLRPLRCAASAAVSRLAQAGIDSETVAFSPDSVRLLSPGDARRALAAVPAVVQDPAAALVIRYAAIPEGARVVDLCAAPGGKAVGLATTASFVAAADLSAGRLSRLKENLDRLDLREMIGMVVADARQPPFAHVDAVLLDAPCTGTGTFRRHPDGRWRIGDRDLAGLARLQKAMLAAAAPLVKPGGLLVYSTCSLEPEENQDQVDVFLADHPEFALKTVAGAVDASFMSDDGFLMVLPRDVAVDGSFAARLWRRI